jgi:UDP-2,3-diacylglucosamine pyrophosphatase LpxH
VNTTIREDRLLIASDIHMGNRLHNPRRRFMDFMHFTIENDYSLCINGDGIDIQQLALSQLTGDLTACMPLFGRFAKTGRQVYFTVGNHDIVLEHFLSDLGRMKVVPFLNVESGDQRIRVEHGHMYDDMFLRFPLTYSVFTFIGRLAIGVSPTFYDWVHELNLRIIAFAEFLFSGFKTKAKTNGNSPREVIKDERGCFRQGAEDVGIRGFDSVIFGHTHTHGVVQLDSGTRYYNTGGWFSNPHCVAIDRGRLWFGPIDSLFAEGDPFPVDPDSDSSDRQPGMDDTP